MTVPFYVYDIFPVSFQWTTFLLHFLQLTSTSELSDGLDAMFEIIMYKKEFFDQSMRFNRWNIRIIDVRIKEVLLYIKASIQRYRAQTRNVAV